MKDVSIKLSDQPGSLADMGEVLGKENVSVEGGGAWVVNNEGVAHFLFTDGEKARRAIESVGIEVLKVSNVLIQRLNQNQPGQLGKITRIMANEGVNIEVIYSDHDNQLILVVDDYEKGLKISANWKLGIYDL